MKKLMILLALMCFPSFALAAAQSVVDAAVDKAAAYIYKTVKAPRVDSVGGEWAVIGLARSGYDAPDSWFSGYYKTVSDYATERGGVLHDRKYTEYSRVIIALTAAGYDPKNVAGYDLTLPLADFDKTVWQGINGAIFALIALDCGNYQNPNRDLYISDILRRQLSDGGFNLTAGNSGEIGENEKSDPDITAMALQALSKYQDREDIKTASEKALNFLSSSQNSEGGYSRSGDGNSESVVQVIVALCEMRIDLNDPRFVKNGLGLVDNLLSYQNEDGSFRHTGSGDGNSQMSTEQAFYGLVAVKRMLENDSSLYDIRSEELGLRAVETRNELADKNDDVHVMPVIFEGKSFSDISGHVNRLAVEALAQRGIISGKTEALFEPNAAVTRAEYAAIVTRGLGLAPKNTDIFSDVSDGDWFSGYVGTAYTYNIVTGTSENTFNPSGTITRQEAAVMTARAAKLCGMDTSLDEFTIRDTLAQFGDYTTAADWSKESLAFCYKEKIISADDFDILPKTNAKRCEIAQMLYNMLSKAELIKN